MKKILFIIFLYTIINRCFINASDIAKPIIEGITVEIPVEMKSALEKSALELNPMSFSWVTQRSTTLDLKFFFITTKMEHNCGFFEPENNIFMWQNGCGYRFRAARTSVKTVDGKMPYAYENDIQLDMYANHYAIDGQCFYAGGALDDAPGVMSIYPLTNDVAFLSHPFTFCSGYKYPTSSNEFEELPTSYILYLNQKGGLISIQKTRIEGSEAFKIESILEGYNAIDQCSIKRIISFWLLPQYNYAVKQIDIKSVDNKLAHRVTNDDFRLLPSKKIYIHHRSTIQHYTYSTINNTILTSPLFTEDIFLTEVSTHKINKKQFDLRNKFSSPGTLVGDRVLQNTDEGVIYVIPANPADLDRVIEAALTGKDFTPRPLPSTAAIVIKWLLCIAGIAMILYAGYRKFIKKT
jgi:hypothetical protein